MDCVVCVYWSERLEETRARALSEQNSQDELRRLERSLKEHRSRFACVPLLELDSTERSEYRPDKFAAFFGLEGIAIRLAFLDPRQGIS